MASGGGGGRGGLGWAILAAALAVPSFLFYNWWSRLKAERDHAIPSKTNKRAGGEVFQTPLPPSGRLVNPISAAPSAPPAAATPAAPTAKPSPPPSAEVSVSTLSAAALPRDPMISPMDSARLQEAALEEARRRRQIEAARRRQKEIKAESPLASIERHIELQGIVAKPNGDNRAIINGLIVGSGGSISIKHYAGKVRIVKITAAEVTLDYQGRKFRLRLNAQ